MTKRITTRRASLARMGKFAHLVNQMVRSEGTTKVRLGLHRMRMALQNVGNSANSLLRRNLQPLTHSRARTALALSHPHSHQLLKPGLFRLHPNRKLPITRLIPRPRLVPHHPYRPLQHHLTAAAAFLPLHRRRWIPPQARHISLLLHLRLRGLLTRQPVQGRRPNRP